jgi:PAS domain S-box-containing protein
MQLHPESQPSRVLHRGRAQESPTAFPLPFVEDFYQDLVQHSEALMCLHDLQGRLLWVNPAPARLLGYSVEELLRIPMREMVGLEFRREFDAYLSLIEREGKAEGLVAVTTRSGERLVWEYHNTLRTEGVEVPVVRGLAYDVTSQTHAEELLHGAGESLMARMRETERIIAELKLFRSLVDQTSDAIEVVDPHTFRFLDVNQTACSDLGYSREELLSMKFFDIDPAIEPPYGRELLKALRESGSLVIESLHRRKDGIIYPVEVSMRLVQLEREYIVAMVHDLTERKLAESRLQASQERYRAVHECAPVGICWADSRTGRFLGVNPKYCEILGRTEQELLQSNFQSVTHPDDLAANLEELRQLLAGEVRHYKLKKRYFRPDGSIRWVEVDVVAMWPEGQNPLWHMAIVQDITDRKLAEEALRSSEENYRNFVTQSSEGIFREDMDAPVAIDAPEDELVRHILYDSYMAECNDAMAKMYGMTSGQEFVGKRLTELLPPEDPRNIELTREYIRSGFRILGRESHEVDIHGNAKVFLNSMIGTVENGMLVRTWGIQRDVTEEMKLEEARRKAEEALRASEAHFRLLVEQSPDGIFIADAQGKYLDVNTAGAEMMGYSRDEILALSVSDIVSGEEVPRIAQEWARFAGGNVTCTEWILRRKDGSRFPGEVVGRRLPDGRLQGILRDITERKRAEQALRESEARERAKSRELEIVLDTVPVPVFVAHDRECRHITTNRAGYQFLRLTPGSNASKTALPGEQPTFRALRDGVEVPDAELPMQSAALNGTPVYGTPLTVAFEDGSEVYTLFNAVPLVDAAGTPTGVIGASIDVTNLLAITEELRQAKEKLSEEKLYLEQAIGAELGFGEIIGRSAALKEVMDKVAKVAPSDATVLLLGETGTGKELVARAVHQMSQRKDSSFIKMNCAAIPSGLLESELFGHERGAFTGAVAKKLGRLELADNGTLFLDEIGEIPLELQPKLLRVLQDQEFERLGANHTIKVNFRLVAATNRDLLASVRLRQFRSDLYYRLNVFPIRIAPLRERRDDIPLLVEHFVRKYAARMNKSITSIPAKTMEVLVQWTWPGNIRELENFIERSVILTPGLVLQPPLAELHPEIVTEKTVTLHEIERERIVRALRDCNGQLGGPNGAAARLGLKRTTLQSKLTHFGINPGDYRA